MRKRTLNLPVVNESARVGCTPGTRHGGYVVVVVVVGSARRPLRWGSYTRSNGVSVVIGPSENNTRPSEPVLNSECPSLGPILQNSVKDQPQANLATRLLAWNQTSKRAMGICTYDGNREAAISPLSNYIFGESQHLNIRIKHSHTLITPSKAARRQNRRGEVSRNVVWCQWIYREYVKRGNC